MSCVACHISCVTCHVSRSEHSLHGCPSSRLSLTKCILVLNVFFFCIICQDLEKNFAIFFYKIQVTVMAAAAPRPTFFLKVITRPWPVADVLAVHHCSLALLEPKIPYPLYVTGKNSVDVFLAVVAFPFCMDVVEVMLVRMVPFLNQR